MTRALSWSLVAVAAVGLATTLVWFEVTGGPAYARTHVGALLAALALIVASTILNLFARWARWHFLLRRFDLRVHTRDSVRLYFATLPAIATPLYLGELVRAPLLSARHPAAWRTVPMVWFTERLTDAAVLAILLAVALNRPGLGLAVTLVWLGIMLAFRAVIPDAGRLTSAPALGVLVGGTAGAWLVSAVALWATLQLMEAPLPLAAAAGAFASGTLLGGIAGVPLGTGVTGSAMIVALERAGVAGDVAAVTVAAFRGGTAWFAVALGLATLVRARARLLAYIRPRPGHQHFDAIASGYADQIPEHIRERLLGRKVALMRRRLAERGIPPGAAGLDVGCGHGWYAAEMALAGYAITGFDSSPEQVAEARRHAASRGASVLLEVADAARLPYASASFDFAYSINVLHHIEAPAARDGALAEITRVLKPGGVFFLHEINTENPAFRTYMGYLFPLLCDIDEGTERWIRPTALPPVPGARWLPEVDFFTFLPDFTPRPVLRALRGVEAWLEASRLRHWSAHYMACLVREPAGSGQEAVSAGARPPRADARRRGRTEPDSLRPSRGSA